MNVRQGRRGTSGWLALGLLGATALAGCGGGEGAASFDTWGEDYIESEIPSDVFVDGWSVSYQKFIVNIGHVRVGEAGGETIAQMDGTRVFDHTKAGVKTVVTFDGLPAQSWDHVSYEIPVATADAELDASASQADKQILVDDEASVHVEGTATNGAVSKTFSWSFAVSTLFDDCKGEKDGKETEGALITNGGTDQIQLTIHGDHLFYDDLQSANANVRFDPIAAADADMDGVITLAELRAVKLVEIDVGTYGTGSASNIDDLGAFVTALSRTVGHFRGEGECFSTEPE